MQITMRSATAIRLAKNIYIGDSKPLSHNVSSDKPLEISWWISQPQKEGADSPRQAAAMHLYLELAKASKHPLGPNRFPARFDFDDGIIMRPDKGVIKVFLDKGLVADQKVGAQLIFELTDAGLELLKRRVN